MSEYQYYEFLAVDRTLSPKEIEAVRGYSSRAEISATRFQNQYHWGSFKGNARDFLARYYDLHLYYANWGTHTFGIGFPLRGVDADRFKPYCSRDATAQCSKLAERVILYFTSYGEGEYWDESHDVTMAALAPLRNEVIGGDLRPLYLAWLAGIFDTNSPLDDDAKEPPVPAGMNKLTPAQRVLATFMRVDHDLLAVAARSSPPLAPATPDPLPWLKSLPSSEKDALLVAVMEGRAGEAATELRARFGRTLARTEAGASARTAGEIRAAAEAAATEREKREAAKAAAARAKELDELAPTRDMLWRQVEKLIGTKLPKHYDQCVKILTDLRDVAHRQGHVAEYEQRMTALRDAHRAKSSLQERFRQAGLV